MKRLKDMDWMEIGFAVMFAAMGIGMAGAMIAEAICGR